MCSATDTTFSTAKRRILLVDDNPSIHEDIRNILRTRGDDPFAAAEAALFGEPANARRDGAPGFEFDLQSAYQGQQALALLEDSLHAEDPYCMAFVDIRMPPGWDGVETIARLRNVDPRLQIVICSAYSDYTWQALHDRLQPTDWLLLLRKPFDSSEIQQLACAISEKWKLGIQAALTKEQLEEMICRYAKDLQVANIELANSNADLLEVNGRLKNEMKARRQAAKRIRHIAYHDALTKLPNRVNLMERLQKCLETSRQQSNYRFAVLFIDVDDFKLINDTLGHRAGDQLLSEIATAMSKSFRAGRVFSRRSIDTVARLGGDEFVILLDNVPDVQSVICVAERIRQAVCRPVEIGDRRFVPSISIGGAMSQDEYEDAVDIMRDADTALYDAKDKGKGCIVMFDEAMRVRVLERAGIENDLRSAIARREFVVYYQPIIFLATGQIFGFEALVRWQHPMRGLLPPDAFLPIAEEAGMIDAIGRQVLEKVTRQVAEWRDAYPHARDLAISVNLSASQLVGDGLLEFIDQCIESHDLSASALRIELTESTAMQNYQRSLTIIDAFTSRGIDVHLDDFGTGYSSLSVLHQLPLSAIKLDKSFVKHLKRGIETEATISALLMISENRKIKVIAEGIETEEQAARLRNLGCEIGQGYLFSRPQLAQALNDLLEAGTVFSGVRDKALVVSQ